jgi:hypothetical protein
MNQFQALKKPEKPIEIWSSPNSPQSTDLFLTPKFSTSEPNTHVIIENLTKENIELKSKVIELSNILHISDINNKLEIKKIINQSERQNQTIQDKYAEAQFISKISPITQKCSEKINQVLCFLEDFAEVNKSLENDVLSLDCCQETDTSLAQEKAKKFELNLAQRQASNTINTNSPDPCIPDTSDPSNRPCVDDLIKKKDKEIAKHKNFIKMLKSSLESILNEHKKSQLANEKHLQEISDLKAELALTRS